MGQVNEKFASLDDNQNEQKNPKKNVKETKTKIDVFKQKQGPTQDQNVKELERALEEALDEREQILEACEKEIGNERNIAVELEQKMMEDFEWKLRDVEGRYRKEIKTLEESVESKSKYLEKWKSLETFLNLKLREKTQECDGNVAYYTQREVEYEAKVDDLMTRLQNQTAAYMNLQEEFDNYEWWDKEELDGGAEGHSQSQENSKRRSRESLVSKTRPLTRPPTITNIQEAEEEERDGEEYEKGYTNTDERGKTVTIPKENYCILQDDLKSTYVSPTVHHFLTIIP